MMTSSREMQIRFWRGLSEKLSAGITLGEALRSLSAIEPVFAELDRAVEKGEVLSEAMAARAEAFCPAMVSMFAAGEQGGLMDIGAAEISAAMEDGVLMVESPWEPGNRAEGAMLCLMGHAMKCGMGMSEAVEVAEAEIGVGNIGEVGAILREAVAERRGIASVLMRLEPRLGERVAEAEKRGELENELVQLGKGRTNMLTDAVLATLDRPEVKQAVNKLLLEAIKLQASSIHLDAEGVRFRVGGVLQPYETPDKAAVAAMIGRLKVMGCMDVSRNDIPQDGRVILGVNGKSMDLEVSTSPTIAGERMTLKVLHRAITIFELNRVVEDQDKQTTLRQMTQLPSGMVLCTGPAGSGKTTLMYSMLMEIDRAKRSVFSVEDPVEVALAGVSQVQVNPAAGLTYVRAMRSILRQDPDVIMVGEIRDLETVQTCCQAAMTGHLVLTQMHTSSAPATVRRLMDLGLESFVLNAALAGVVAQRLVRRLCPKCRRRVDVATRGFPAEVAEIMGNSTATLYAPGGCEACHQTGYRGCLAIHEILPMSPKLADAIAGKASTAELLQVARTGGMRTMLEDGMLLAARGETSVEQVLAATR